MEWIKISKKIILLIVGLFIVQALLFIYSVNMKESETDDFLREKDLDYDEEYISEQIAYIDNYNQSVENVINQSQSIGGISIFSKLDSFSKSNLEQTRQAFENIIYVEPVAFNDIFIKQFFMYTATNGFILLAGVFIALSLVESKKNSMRILLHCTKRGRKELVLQKLVTLFYCNVIIITAFTVGNIVISAIHFEGDILQCLSYPIQSVSYFSKFVYKLNIGEFMLVYILYKVVIMFMITAIVWLITYCVDNILFSCGIIGVLGAISYIIYSVIDINHPLNFLRYCNFWYLLKDASVFMEYKNLNWHDKAINKDVFIAMFVLIFIILVIVVSLVVSVKKYPINSWSYKKIGDIVWINKMKLFISNMNEKLSVTMFEYYKVFIKQKGIIVVLILLYIIISQIDMQEINRSKSQLLYYEFMENYQGVQNEASEKYIED